MFNKDYSLPTNFFKVSNKIFALKLSPSDFLVYCFLSSCHPDYNPSKEQMSKRLNLSKPTIIKSIKMLRHRGLLIPNGFNKDYKTRRYKIVKNVKNDTLISD